MLFGTDFVEAELVAARDFRQAAAILAFLRLVAAFLIEAQETVENDAGRWRQADGASFASISMVVRSSCTLSIWLATVRFQTSS